MGAASGTGGVRGARPRRTSRLAEARAAAALPQRRGAGGRSPAKGRRHEGCRRPRRGLGTRGRARPPTGESGGRVVGDDARRGYRGGPLGERNIRVSSTSGWSGQSFVRSNPQASTLIRAIEKKYRNCGLHVSARTSTLVAEEPATRRRGTCVGTRVRVLSAGSVDRSTRLIGVEGSGRTRNRA